MQAELRRAQEAVRAAPGDADAHGRLGSLLIGRARAQANLAMARGEARHAAAANEYRRAIAHLREAARLRAASGQAARLLGIALRELGELTESAEVLDAAARTHPHDPDIGVELAFARQCLGDTSGAIERYETVLRDHPDHAGAHASLALSLLGAGDYTRGWAEYEWRLRAGNTIYRPYPFAFWRGEPLEGRRILITSEQGVGDEVMFASCFPEIIERAAECFIECGSRLVDLFARSFPRATVFARDLSRMPDWSALGRFDFHVPGGSLPQYLRKTIADFPRRRAYLVADAAKVRGWRERLDRLGPGLKVGLAWTGGLAETLGAVRSMALADLGPVLEVPGVRFVSLEFGDTSRALPWWPETSRDLDESAALVSALDLVITVTTATAHLAGALGTACWIAIPGAATWRYGWSGETLPWYPHARVFRGGGDRGRLAVRLAEELGAVCAQEGARSCR